MGRSQFPVYHAFMFRMLEKHWHRHELALLVIVVCALLALVAFTIGPKIGKGNAKAEATKDVLKDYRIALKKYRADIGNYPSMAAGLTALTTCPAHVDRTRWRGPYISELSHDAYKQLPNYFSPGRRGEAYEVISRGKDGKLGTKDDVQITDPTR